MRGQWHSAQVQWFDLFLFRWADLHVQFEHLRADELLDRLHGSQCLQRKLRGFLQRQLCGQLELLVDARPERQRFVHGKFDVSHRLFRLVLGELLDRVDL